MIKQRVKRLFYIINWWLGQFGIRPVYLFRAFYEFPYVVKNYISFKKKSNWRVFFKMPCLHDRTELSGTTSVDYFKQDLYVAKKIYVRNPVRHLDVGSRVDGFVAHVASFREIEAFDIRQNNNVLGIIFHQMDLMKLQPEYIKSTDSLSCLHSLEHFGLGRYGDPIDPDGHKKGLQNMVDMLKPEGVFYLSVPMGAERVEFNAHRVFCFETILELSKSLSLNLFEFAWIDNQGELYEYEIKNCLVNEIFTKQLNGLGIFTFRKIK